MEWLRKAKESQGGGYFKSGGRAQSGADGDLSIDQKICAADGEAFALQKNQNAAYVIGPVVRGLRFRFVNRERCRFGFLKRLDRYICTIVSCAGHESIEADCGGHHISVVVVGVFAD